MHTGNNFYNAELAQMLATLSETERAEFILMERIQPPLQPAVLVRQVPIKIRKTFFYQVIFQQEKKSFKKKS